MIELTLTCDKCGEKKSYPQNQAGAYDYGSWTGDPGPSITAKEDIDTDEWKLRLPSCHLLYCRSCHESSRKKEESED